MNCDKFSIEMIYFQQIVNGPIGAASPLAQKPVEVEPNFNLDIG